jgi:hypothetical protein
VSFGTNASPFAGACVGMLEAPRPTNVTTTLKVPAFVSTADVMTYQATTSSRK